MNEIDSEAVLRRLDQAQKLMAASLRKLADRIERLQFADSCEVLVWTHPHVDELLAESDRILQATDAEA